jgi:hypothetical protein
MMVISVPGVMPQARASRGRILLLFGTTSQDVFGEMGGRGEIGERPRTRSRPGKLVLLCRSEMAAAAGRGETGEGRVKRGANELR